MQVQKRRLDASADPGKTQPVGGLVFAGGAQEAGSHVADSGFEVFAGVALVGDHQLATVQRARPKPQRDLALFVVSANEDEQVVAESESTARAPRTGTVLEVLRGDPSPRYRIGWNDGHTTSYTPAAGALHAARKPAGTAS